MAIEVALKKGGGGNPSFCLNLAFFVKLFLEPNLSDIVVVLLSDNRAFFFFVYLYHLRFDGLYELVLSNIISDFVYKLEKFDLSTFPSLK